MSVPKTFQNQIGTVQLSDLDDNFLSLDNRSSLLESRASSLEGRSTTLESRATTLESRATSLESRTTTIESKVVNLNQWTIVETNGNLYFKINGATKMTLFANGNLKIEGNIVATSSITAYGT